MKKEHEKFLEQISNEIKNWTEENRSSKNYWKIYLINSPLIFSFLAGLTRLKNLTKNERALILAAIAYFINPFDYLPESILGALGYLDDVVVSAFVINRLFKKIPEKFISDNWKGKLNFKTFINNILTNADHIVDDVIYKKLKKEFYNISRTD